MLFHNVQEATSFLRRLWNTTAGVPRGQLALAALESGRPMSNKFIRIGSKDAGDNVREFIEARASADIYFRVASIKPNWVPSKSDWRGNVINSHGLPGFYADIDCMNDQRKKSGLPTSRRVIDECIKQLQFPPTYITNTGGGVHLYWLFNTPWIFTSPDERAHAASLSRNWFRTIVKPAFGEFEIDNVSDLARILRLPGTVNQKYNVLSNVDPLSNDDERYDVLDLREILDPTLTPSDRALEREIANPTSYRPPQPITDGDVKLSTTTQRIVREIKSAKPKFAKTWNRNRKDLEDTSPSAYEFALIMNALTYDSKLTNETLIEMCSWWRRVHKIQPRVDSRGNVRVDQYINEIQKCRTTVEVDNRRVEDWDELLGMTATPAPDNQNDDLIIDEDDEKGVLEHSPNSNPKVKQEIKNDDVRPMDETSSKAISQFPGLRMGPPSSLINQEYIKGINTSFETEIMNIYYVPGEPHIYLIVSKSGEVISCKIEDISVQHRWANVIGNLTGSFPITVGAKEWPKARQVILKCREQLDLGITPANFMEQSLRNYISKFVPDNWDSREIAIGANRPFYFENNPDNRDIVVKPQTHVCFDLGELNRFVRYQQFSKPPTQPAIWAKLAGWREVFIKYSIKTSDGGKIERTERLYFANVEHLVQ